MHMQYGCHSLDCGEFLVPCLDNNSDHRHRQALFMYALVCKTRAIDRHLDLNNLGLHQAKKPLYLGFTLGQANQPMQTLSLGSPQVIVTIRSGKSCLTQTYIFKLTYLRSNLFTSLNECNKNIVFSDKLLACKAFGFYNLRENHIHTYVICTNTNNPLVITTIMIDILVC